MSHLRVTDSIARRKIPRQFISLLSSVDVLADNMIYGCEY